MLKKTITYEDYNGVERTEDFYFNLSQAELMDMQLGVTGGYAEMLQKIIQAKDQPAIVAIFKELILKSYGEKSADGRRFIKSKELSDEFAQTEAFSELYMELATSDEAAAAFVNGVIPAKLAAEVEKQTKNGTLVPMV